jgi:hypothetical protein
MPLQKLPDSSRMLVSAWRSMRVALFCGVVSLHEMWLTSVVLDEPWHELLSALFQASESADASHREGAFRIFTTTPGIIEKQHGELVKKVFVQGFNDPDQKVRIAAMEAFLAFFRSIKKSAQKLFYDLLLSIMQIPAELKAQQDSDGLSQALRALIDLAEIAPVMFKPAFNDVVKFSIEIVQDKGLSDQARQNALEFLATFADTAPNMCRKDPSYTSEMVTQCLSLMTDIGADDEDASQWNETDDVRPSLRKVYMPGN